MVFSSAAIRELDRLAVERYGIPSIVLMENAARGASAVALKMLKHDRAGARGDIVIVCGPGNNGGDGFAMARLLTNAVGSEHAVRIVLALGPPTTDDARINANTAKRMSVPMIRATARRPLGRSGRPALLIDAIFGTGLSRPIAGVAAACVGAINTWQRKGVPVLAVDVPSGFDADQGVVVGASERGARALAVQANTTVTFVGKKVGMRGVARGLLGRVVVADIGVPLALMREMATPPLRESATRIRRRRA